MSIVETPSHAVIEQIWAHHIEPALHDYIRIPNVSEAFDAKWREHGHMQHAVDLIHRWCASRPIVGLTVEIHEILEDCEGLVLRRIFVDAIRPDRDAERLEKRLRRSWVIERCREEALKQIPGRN